MWICHFMKTFSESILKIFLPGAKLKKPHSTGETLPEATWRGNEVGLEVAL